MVDSSLYKIIWDSVALEDIKKILHHLKQQSLFAPRIVKKVILDKINQNQKYPLIFEQDKVKEQLIEYFRAFTAYSYRVTYQIPINKTIRILRVRHTSREPLIY